MRRLKRFILWVVVALILTACLSEAAIQIAKLSTRHSAEGILVEAKGWTVGETSWSETREFRSRYSARRMADSRAGELPEQNYRVDAFSSSLNYLAFRYPGSWKFGIRPSGVSLEFSYRDQKLSFMRYTFYTAALASSGTREQLLAVFTERRTEDAPGPSQYRVGYGVRPSSFEPNGEEHGVGTIITSRASPLERRAAFDFDLSCLSALNGCQLLCKMAPSTWKEAIRQSARGEIALPKEEIENPECLKGAH